MKYSKIMTFFSILILTSSLGLSGDSYAGGGGNKSKPKTYKWCFHLVDESGNRLHHDTVDKSKPIACPQGSHVTGCYEKTNSGKLRDAGFQTLWVNAKSWFLAPSSSHHDVNFSIHKDNEYKTLCFHSRSKKLLLKASINGGATGPWTCEHGGYASDRSRYIKVWGHNKASLKCDV